MLLLKSTVALAGEIYREKNRASNFEPLSSFAISRHQAIILPLLVGWGEISPKIVAHCAPEPPLSFAISSHRATILPLPAGEGRGEGESFERESRAVHGEGESCERR
jgi:hypothetical protein